MEKVILEREALKLPAHERALLADALLGSLDDEAVRNAEAACAQESEDRYQAFLRGEIEAVDGPTVFRQL
ncbi:MAG: addiction module protein [Verrucomicrobiia bacterium]